MITNANNSSIIEVWDDQLIRLSNEWNVIIERRAQQKGERIKKHVTTWKSALDSMQLEYEALVAKGEWLRGPSDLLSIIGRPRYETYHSAMIAWLLDPLARHGLGDRFLRSFLIACNVNWSFDNAQLATPTITCEEARDNCRADIIFRIPGFTLVIENKVNAGEGDTQCDRLFSAFIKNEDAHFLFLTPSGRRPRTATGEAAEAFCTLSYSQLRSCLKSALDDTSNSAASVGRATAINYLTTLMKDFR